MPPKVVGGRGRGKAKGKGKGKAKGKGNGKAYGKAKARAAAAAAEQEPLAEGTEQAPSAEGTEGADGYGPGAIMEVKPKAKAKGASALRKKIMGELGEKSLEEAFVEAKSVLTTADATIAEAAALEEAQAAQAAATQEEFEQAQKEVEEAIAQESAATENYRLLKEKRQEALAKIDEQRRELFEAQKTAAMVEVMATSHKKFAELEERRKAATEAADAAKRHLLEQRQKEKDALEATRKALEHARSLKGGGKGAKRVAAVAAEAPPAKHTTPADQQDTVPATLVDGEDIE